MAWLVDDLVNAYWTNLTNSDNMQIQQQINRENYRNQREFAQNSIQWKVADAQKAGIHPLYAMGATGTSYTPSSTAYQSRAPQMDMSGLGILLGLSNQEAQNNLLDSQSDYYKALTQDIKNKPKALDSQNSNQMNGLVGWYNSEGGKKVTKSGDNLAMFGLSGDDIKQPLADNAGESHFFANQRALAQGILDGTIDYSKVDEYITALGPGVKVTNGETIAQAFMDTIAEQGKRFFKGNTTNLRAFELILKSSASFKEKLRMIQQLKHNNSLSRR